MLKAPYLRILFEADDQGILDIDKLVNRLSLSRSTIKRYLKELERQSFLERIDVNKYRLTENGLKLKQSLSRVLETEKVAPYIITDPSSGQPLPLAVKDHEQLFIVIKYSLVGSKILDEHIRRRYLSKWLRDVMGDEYLASLIDEGRINSSEELRDYLEEIMKFKNYVEKLRTKY